MNYPFRDAILGFLLGGDPLAFCETVESILENYPPQCVRLLMNHIGTHDTERALTVLGGEPSGSNGREWQSCHALSPEQREKGRRRLKLASLLQFTLPGIPCIYYGDEAGLEGYKDPFNRSCYPGAMRIKSCWNGTAPWDSCAGSREASWQKEASAPGMQTAIFSPTSGIRRRTQGKTVS